MKSPKTNHLWRKKPEPGLKLFRSVAPSSSTKQSIDLPATSISFTKLVTQILPTAARVWIKVPAHRAIFFFITGYEGSKPLMQWHTDTHLVSGYVYNNPRHVVQHGLRADDWNEAQGLVPGPWLWHVSETANRFPLPTEEALREELSHVHTKHGFKYVFLLEKVYDQTTKELCLFPEFLKGELHGVRSTIERYSREGRKEIPENIGRRGGWTAGVVYARVVRP